MGSTFLCACCSYPFTITYVALSSLICSSNFDNTIVFTGKLYKKFLQLHWLASIGHYLTLQMYEEVVFWLKFLAQMLILLLLKELLYIKLCRVCILCCKKVLQIKSWQFDFRKTLQNKHQSYIWIPSLVFTMKQLPSRSTFRLDKVEKVPWK
jgi:hypothetical protein